MTTTGEKTNSCPGIWKSLLRLMQRPPDRVRRGWSGAHTRHLRIDRPNHALGDGYHVHSNGPVFYILGRRRRLVQPQGAVLAGVHHDGRAVLPGRRAGGLRPLRNARDLQYRPGQPVHQLAFTECSKTMASPSDGWQGSWKDNVFVRMVVAERQSTKRSI